MINIPTTNTNLSNSTKQLSAEVVLTNDGLTTLKDEWNKLLLNSNASTIFLTWEWVEAWWEIYGQSRELFVITVRDNNNELVGIAPFYRESRRLFGVLSVCIVRFLGIGGDVAPNYLDIIVRRGMEQEVVRTIMGQLEFSRNLWNILELADIPEKSISLLHFEREIKKYKWQFDKMHHTACPFILLPKTWDEYLKTKSGSFRKKIKYYLRALSRDFKVDFYRVERLEELNSKMELLEMLHLDRWANQLSGFQSKDYNKFHKIVSRRFLENGWLRLYFLTIDDKEVGALYCYSFANTMSFYQSGRLKEWDQNNVGTVTLTRSVQEAIKEGLKEFDFLCGIEEYKYRWADHQRQNILIRIWTISYKNHCFLLQDWAVKIAKMTAKKLFPSQLVKWIKDRRNP